MSELSLLQIILLSIIPILFAVTLHEVAHGWMAKQLGDRTAELMGRLTVNPIKHIDPVGTIIVPLAMYLLGGFIFGWAKIIAKLVISFVSSVNPFAQLLVFMAWVGIIINSLLMVLNLFPIPPLDGSRVVFSILPAKLASRYAKIEPYGLIILIVIFSILAYKDMLKPIIIGFQQLVYALVF
jgi:Zn-dependent protease